MFSLSDSIQISSFNTPLDVRTRVANLNNLTDGSIQMPYVGLPVWVTSEEKVYVVTGITGTLITSYKPIGDDVVGTFAYTVGTTKSSELSEAIGANKIITIGNYVASVEMVGTGSSAYYVVSYTDKDGVFHQITHTSQADSTGSETTKEFAEVETVNSTSELGLSGVIGGIKKYQGNTMLDLGGVSGSGTLGNVIKNLISLGTHVDADNTNNVFAIKNINNDAVGTITLSTAASGAAVLTFADNNNGSFIATLPNLRYDSDNQMLKMVKADGTQTNLIKLSNLQIKGVGSTLPCWDTTATPDPVSREAKVATGAPHWAIGDLFLLENSSTTPSTFNLCVCTNVVDDGTYYNYSWENIGSINNVSLQADQVTLNSTKLSTTNVKDGLEELYDKVDAVGASYWTGSIGISSATTYSSVSGLTEYNKQSEPIDVYVTTAGYLWIVSSVKIIAETSGIEIPMLAPVKSSDLYYYRSEEIVKESISVMVKALAKQEGTDPNDNITISGDALTTITKTAGDAYVILSLPTITSNNGGILSYQWEKGGLAIQGAQGQTYNVGYTNTDNELVESDSGHYRCKVTNSLGGYEYTKGTILVVNASQGDIPSGEGWLQGYAVQNNQIVENSNYSISPVYDVDPSDEIVIHTGYVNSDSNINVISAWSALDGGECINIWYDIRYKTRLIKMSASSTPTCRYIRVTFNNNYLNRAFIYNKTKGTWLYGSDEIRTRYNGFEFFKYAGGYNSGTETRKYYNVHDLQYNKFYDKVENITYLSPVIALPNISSEIIDKTEETSNYEFTICTGPRTSTNCKIVFCDSEGNIKVNNSGNQFLANTSDPRTHGLFGDASHFRIYIPSEYLHESYIILRTRDNSVPESYLWRGLDVPNLSNN